MKTHKVGSRCSPREVKTVNRYVAGAAPSPVEAKKVCSAPRLSAWHVLMHLVWQQMALAVVDATIVDGANADAPPVLDKV